MIRSTFPSREAITTTAYTSNIMPGTSSITSEERSSTATYVAETGCLMTLTSTTYPEGNQKLNTEHTGTHLLLL